MQPLHYICLYPVPHITPPCPSLALLVTMPSPAPTSGASMRHGLVVPASQSTSTASLLFVSAKSLDGRSQRLASVHSELRSKQALQQVQPRQ